MAKVTKKTIKKADKAAKGKKAALSENDLTDLINQAAEIDDHTETSKGGGGGYKPAAEGRTFARFIGYIEQGMQKQRPIKGAPIPPKEEVILRFELLKEKNIREIEVDGKKVKIADRIDVKLTKSTNEASSFKMLFEKMRDEREEITHFAQMLGEGFIVTVTNESYKKDGKEVTYSTLKDKAKSAAKGSYAIEPPFTFDEDTEKRKKVKIPEALSPKMLFIWKLPTLASWESIFISEKYNPYQTAITKAENFPGSPIYDVLEGSDLLPDLSDVSEDDVEDEDEVEDDEDEIEDDEDESDDENDSDEDEADEDEDEDEDSEEDEADEEEEDDVEEDDGDEEEEEEEAPAPKKSTKKAAAKEPTKKASKTKPAKGKAGSKKAKDSEAALDKLFSKRKK